MTQTIQSQTFEEQADDTLEAVVLVAQMASDPSNYNINLVNMLNDNQIESLNMFASTCDELHDESDHRSLNLAKKKVFDKFEALKKEDFNAYKLATPHYEFMKAALNGHRNLRFNASRVNDSVKPLFENNPTQINKAFGKMIQSKQNFDKRQDSFKKPDVNKELAARHQSELREFHNNDKYKNNTQKYNMPNQTHFYFTNSGKNSKFVDKKAAARKKEEEKLGDILMGESDTDIYKVLQSKTPFMNAVLKASPNVPVGHFRQPVCVQILKPDKKQRAKQNKNTITIRPCHPWDNRTIHIHDINMLELNTKLVKRAEKRHIQSRRQLGDKQGLGSYKSIKEQESQMMDFD